MRDIRDNLRIYLKNKGYKQTSVARLSGINESTFYQIITKRMRLQAETMFNICDSIGITPNELRDYDEPEIAR